MWSIHGTWPDVQHRREAGACAPASLRACCFQEAAERPFLPCHASPERLTGCCNSCMGPLEGDFTIAAVRNIKERELSVAG